MSTLSFTFGIQLEFVCIRPKDAFGLVGEAINDTLRRSSVPATGQEDLEEDIVQGEPSYTRWRVDTDCLDLSVTEHIHPPESWLVEAVGLSSRKFHFFTDDWRGEIFDVLSCLRELEAVAGCRFITNKSTGFHVHVDNDTEKITLRTAKNVLRLATARERCFDDLHAVPRIEVHIDSLIYNNFYWPPSFFFINNSAKVHSYFFHRLAKMESASTHEQLALFSPIWEDDSKVFITSGYNWAINFDNLYANLMMYRYEENLTGTIEFRQHCGTLDYLEIVPWIILTYTIVQFCANVLEICLRAADKDFTLHNLLPALDCNEDVMDHTLSGGEIIGFIADSDEETLFRFDVAKAIIEQNELECECRMDKVAVQATVKEKWHYGFYGLEPDATVHLPILIDEGRAYVAGIDARTETGISKATALLYQTFAMRYEQARGLSPNVRM